MTGTARLRPHDLELCRDQVPRGCLAEALADAVRRGILARGPERHGSELQALAQDHQQLAQSLQSRGLNAALDATDCVLAGPGPERETTLTDPVSRSSLSQQICRTTPHTVSC